MLTPHQLPAPTSRPSGELLRHSLITEPDVQHLIDLLLYTVAQLGGRAFVASKTLLAVLAQLRREGAGSGRPLVISLYIQQQQLWLYWDQQQARACLANLPCEPSRRQLRTLTEFLQNSLHDLDPQLLLQRNVEMKYHFEQEQLKAEKAFLVLQQSLRSRQQELEEAVLRAETDALTGLLNRRSFDLRIKQAFLHTMRQRNAPLSLILLDLDYFKQINDTHGHQYGDEYLNLMASALRDIIRENVDLAFRFGGDEFAVLIFADHQQAQLKAQQVLTSMHNKVSIGITEINANTEEDLTLEEFIHRADEALYEAKRKGRGQVVVNV